MEPKEDGNLGSFFGTRALFQGTGGGNNELRVSPARLPAVLYQITVAWRCGRRRIYRFTYYTMILEEARCEILYDDFHRRFQINDARLQRLLFISGA